MSGRSRVESIGVVVALLASLAFVASFALGLRGGGNGRAVDRSTPVVADPAPRTGRVEVLNASGRSGVARSVTQRLRTAGFDVVYFGNAAASHGDSTVVLDRTGRDDIARAVARELKIGRVVTRRDTTLFLDATVVLGKDWDDAAGSRSSIGRSRQPRRSLARARHLKAPRAPARVEFSGWRGNSGRDVVADRGR